MYTRIKRIGLLSCLCLIVFLLIFSNFSYCEEEEKIIEINIQHINLAEHPVQAACEYFAKHVEEEAKGRVKVKIYKMGILAGGDWRVMLDQLSTNVTQIMIDETVTFALNFDPKFYILSYPFLFDDTEHQKRFFAGPTPQALLDIYKLAEKKGVKVLAVSPGDFRQFFNNKRTIKVPEDLKGLKIRIPPLPLFEKIADALEFKGITLPTGEVFVALQLNTIDGQENIFVYSCEQKIYEVAKYITISDYMGQPTIFAINLDFWNSLPSDIKEIITRNIKKATEVSTERYLEIRQKWLKRLEENKKVEVYFSSQSEKSLFREKMKIISDYLEQLVGKTAFEEILTAVEKCR